MQNSVRNYHLCHVLFSTSVGILLTLWSGLFQLSPQFYLLLLVRSALRQDLYFHAARCRVPYKACRKNRHRNRKLPHYGNLAFGGRGSPYVVRGRRTFKFDSTLGFPGEGWAKLTFATWNTRSLTYERMQYCRDLGYDVLAITELWRNQARYQTRSKSFIASEPTVIAKGPRQGEVRYPEDKAAGVGILLSDRLTKKSDPSARRGNEYAGSEYRARCATYL